MRRILWKAVMWLAAVMRTTAHPRIERVARSDGKRAVATVAAKMRTSRSARPMIPP